MNTLNAVADPGGNPVRHATHLEEHDLDDTRREWNTIAQGYDRTNTPTQMWLGNEGLRRAGLRAGMRFVDVAAGSGALSIPAARIGAKVLATDLSPVMLALLEQRARTEGLDIEVRAMDGHALDLPDDSFDLAGSQFGVMLFPDMPKGISEMMRVVRPGGRVLMNVYGDPHRIDFLQFFVESVGSVRPGFEGPPMDPLPLPFQLHDPQRLRHELAAAGLQQVEVETITEVTEFRSGNQLWEWIASSNPIVDMILSELSVNGDEKDAIRQALQRMVRDRAGGRAAARLANPINIGIGTKPKV